MRAMFFPLLALLICSAPVFGQAKKADPRDVLIKELRQEIAELKAKIADLEKKLAPAAKPDANRITQDNYAKIKVNMMLSEVEKILGPGKEVSRAGPFVYRRWRGKNVEIEITFRIAYFANQEENPAGFTVNAKSIDDQD